MVETHNGGSSPTHLSHPVRWGHQLHMHNGDTALWFSSGNAAPEPQPDRRVPRAGLLLGTGLGGRGGEVFACSLAYGFHEAGGEVAHAVVAGPIVVDAALPAPICMLLQHLWAWSGKGRAVPPHLHYVPPALCNHTHSDDVSSFHIEAGQVIVVAIVLDSPHLQCS